MVEEPAARDGRKSRPYYAVTRGWNPVTHEMVAFVTQEDDQMRGACYEHMSEFRGPIESFTVARRIVDEAIANEDFQREGRAMEGGRSGGPPTSNEPGKRPRAVGLDWTIVVARRESWDKDV